MTRGALFRVTMSLAAVAPCLCVAAMRADGQSIDPQLQEEESRRIAVVEKITPATIAVFDNSGQGGGSGVIVSPDGFAVTNFHVVAPCGHTMKCGLPDGRLVDAVLVGLDPPGDVAVIRLLKKEDDVAWPVAEWGDSDAVQIGDEAFVAGNPFLLAHDYRPTITHGVISGTHRYQYPAGTLLEYADCLQTDASINPGNSGGPLYNGRGQLIGINGRASFEKRGRVNVGVGYAISANQVRRFLSHLMSGRIVDHASLGATVRTAGGGRVVIDQIRSDSDAYRRGLRYGDEIVRFGDRLVTSANDLQNALGTYPPGWRVPILYRRGYDARSAVVKLGRLHGAAQLESLVMEQLKSEPASKSDEAIPNDPRRFVELKPGYANHHFNRVALESLLESCPQQQALAGSAGATLRGREVGGDEVVIRLGPQKAEMEFARGRFWAELEGPLDGQLAPPGSGGFLAAFHLARLLLSGEAPVTTEAIGVLPWGASLQSCEVVSMFHGGVVAEFYFALESHDLIAVEFTTGDQAEPCFIEFSDFLLGPSAALPARVVVRRGDASWLELTLDEFAITPAENAEPVAQEGQDD